VALDVKGWTSVEGKLLVSLTGGGTKEIAYTATRTEKKNTMRRTMIIGSLNFSRYSFHKGSFSGGGMMFFPTPDLTFSESLERQVLK
jgi:hypothetical protein